MKKEKGKGTVVLQKSGEIAVGVGAALAVVKVAKTIVEAGSELSGGASTLTGVSNLGGGSFALGLVAVAAVAAVGTVAAVGAMEHYSNERRNHVR